MKNSQTSKTLKFLSVFITTLTIFCHFSVAQEGEQGNGEQNVPLITEVQDAGKQISKKEFNPKSDINETNLIRFGNEMVTKYKELPIKLTEIESSEQFKSVNSEHIYRVQREYALDYRVQRENAIDSKLIDFYIIKSDGAIRFLPGEVDVQPK